MTYPPYLRAKAQELRAERRMTIDEISERLAISRTTVYDWVGDIPIERKPWTSWPASAGRQATHAIRRKYRLLREAAYDEGTRLFPVLDGYAGFRDFVCLYIAEGYKRSRNAVSICNSEPAVMRLAYSWMSTLAANPLRYSLQHHADQDPNRLSAFWGGELGIDPARINIQRKSNSAQLRKRTWRSEFGVLQIEAGDTYFRAELQAWMDWLLDEWLDSPR